MDIRSVSEKVLCIFKKYSFAFIVVAIGLVLMIIPTVKDNENQDNIQNPTTSAKITTDKQLAYVLSQIKGAGNVEIMLTEAAGEEVLYQTNNNDNTSENTTTSKRDTVIITDANRNQSGLIRQINPPSYLGVVVVCQGADNPSVKLAIVDAVSKLTGLGANRISVLKMK